MVAFPSTSGSRQENVASAWERARSTAGAIKSRAQQLNAAAMAGNISSSLILGFATYLADARLAMQSAASVQGIAAYAQAQINDPTFDIVTSYNDLVTTIDATIAWVIANFPKDASGYLLATQFNANNSGRTVDRQFTPAQTAGLRTTLDTLIAAIN